MFTDLFVHRMTAMLAATGLRFPGRVTGSGGIFLEYDMRQVPDCTDRSRRFLRGRSRLYFSKYVLPGDPSQPGDSRSPWFV